MFITFKRWALKDGSRESEVVALIREFILPAYRQLRGCLGIGLLRIEGTTSYLATQVWQSRAARDAEVSSESYSKWYAAYTPALEKWDEMMVLEDAWEAVEMLDFRFDHP